MIRVVFRVDAGSGIGAGHMMRCLALAEALCLRGGFVALLTASSSPLPAGWSALDAEVRRCPSADLGGPVDLAMTAALAAEVKADWVVVDGYHFDVPWLDALGHSWRLLYLDDLGERDAAATVVLNQNAGAESRYCDAYRRCQRSLLGLEWFLLGSAWRDVQHTPEARRLLLTLGGSGGVGLMLALMRAMLAHGGRFFADVVIPAPPAEAAELMRFARDHADRFKVEEGPLPLPPMMARAAVVICGGGVTPVEVLSLGAVPVILMLAENQVPGSRQLAAMGAARIVPAHDDAVVAAARMAQELLDDGPALLAMVAAGRRLVDGRGAERVVQVMMRETT